MLTEKQILKFQTMYKNRFGEEISEQEAREKGTRLVGLIKAVYAPEVENKIRDNFVSPVGSGRKDTSVSPSRTNKSNGKRYERESRET
jgi:hypothetical protein